jgi:hypothetical protein
MACAKIGRHTVGATGSPGSTNARHGAAKTKIQRQAPKAPRGGTE